MLKLPQAIECSCRWHINAKGDCTLAHTPSSSCSEQLPWILQLIIAGTGNTSSAAYRLALAQAQNGSRASTGMGNATAMALSDYIAYVAGNGTNVGTVDTVYPSLDVDEFQVTPHEYCPAVHWATAVGHSFLCWLCWMWASLNKQHLPKH